MKTTKYTVISPKLEKEHRILMISDVHNMHWHGLVKKVRRLRPDFIVIVGDLVDCHAKKAQRVLPFLRAISSVAPCYLTFGNHDVKFWPIDNTEIEEMGITILDGRFVKRDELVLGGQTSLAGVEDVHPERESHAVWRQDVGMEWLDDFEQTQGYRLLLCHHPEYYDRYLLSDRDIDLIVAGHTHGGQWRFFGHAFYASGQGVWPKFSRGVYGHMIVGAGVSNPGAPLIPRICNPRELLLLTLKPGNDSRIKEH